MAARRGVFICIEGLDASGKTTQARRLVENLQKMGFDVVYTAEPTYSEIGKYIRRYVLKRKKRVPSVVEALLFALDRVNHVEKRIKPALRDGKIVVSDRYVFSSLAYQGAAGLDLRWIEEINKFALLPDLAIYIDVPPEVVARRIRKRWKSVMETLQNQQRVRDIYMKLVESGKLTRVNGNRPKNEVSGDILKIVLNFLRKLKRS